MQERFYQLLIDIKTAERYYCHYTDQSTHYDAIITGVCLFASAASIGSWAIWDKYAIVWAILLGTSQLLTVLRPLFKYSARQSAAKYLLPEMCYLLNDVVSFWDAIYYQIDSISDKDIHQKYKYYQDRFTAIHEKYAASALFPENRKLHQKAQTDVATYFSVQYNINMEEIVHV